MMFDLLQAGNKRSYLCDQNLQDYLANVIEFSLTSCKKVCSHFLKEHRPLGGIVDPNFRP